MTTFLSLHSDILRFLVIDNLTIKETFTFSQVCRHTYRSIYPHDSTWWSLIQKHLTNHSTRLETIKAKQRPQELIRSFYSTRSPSERIVLAAKLGYEIYVKDRLDDAYLFDHTFDDMLDEVPANGCLDIYILLTDRYPHYDHGESISGAVRSCNLEVVQYIINKIEGFSDFREQLQDGIMATFKYECLEIREYLLSKGASLIGYGSDWTIPFGVIVSYDTKTPILDNIKYLLDHKVVITDYMMKLLLITNYRKGVDESVKFLIDEGHYNLHEDILSWIGPVSLDLVPFFLACGITRIPPDLLRMAIISGNATVVDTLLKQGVEIAPEALRKSIQCSHGLVDKDKQKFVRILQLLIDYKADLSVLSLEELVRAPSYIEEYLIPRLIESGVVNIEEYKLAKEQQKEFLMKVIPVAPKGYPALY